MRRGVWQIVILFVEIPQRVETKLAGWIFRVVRFMSEGRPRGRLQNGENPRMTTTTLTTAEQEALVDFARSSVADAQSETALMLTLEPSVSAQLAEGVSLDACKARVFKSVAEYAETLNKKSADYGFLTAMLETSGKTKLGRIVKNIERRQIVGPIFEVAEVDINLARADFLDRWGQMAKAAIAVDMDLADMVHDHIVPNASAKGKLKGQFTRQTADKVVAELKPEVVEIPQAEGDEEPEGEAVEVSENEGIINAWHDFEARAFAADLSDSDRDYIIAGMETLIENLS